MMQALQRIYAIVLRQVYLMRRSLPRMVTFAFWPTIQMVIWGFLNKFLYAQGGLANFTLSTLLGASLLNSFFERSNINIMFSFLEDVWARNMGNILITPIRPVELVIGYVMNGTIAVAFGMGVACVTSYLLFDYSLFTLGLPLIPFILNLVLSGWCIGMLLIAMILRFGPAGESFGWMMAFLFMPLVAIYYPVSILPPWLGAMSLALPPTYVFESLRELIATGHFNMHHFHMALGLNVVYLLLTITIFLRQLQNARRHGGLFAMSE